MTILRRTARSWPALAGVLLLSGCVHVYQPMVGLQQPVVVDYNAPNLEGVKVTVRCYPGDALNMQEASALCLKVGVLFENQGADVTIGLDARVRDSGEQVELAEDAAPPTELIVELRSRELAKANDPLRWAACIATYSIVPAITETAFAQDVTIRDGSGFLLAQETLQGRIVRYVGIGAWAGNQVLNYTLRAEEDRVLQDTANRDLSHDLYRQLSQLVYNAKVQAELLKVAVPGEAL